MNGLDILWVVVPKAASHAFGIDMVGHHIVIIREFMVANCTYPVLFYNLAIQEFAHFRRRAEFAISSRVMWVFNAADANLHNLFLSDWLSATAGPRPMDWAQLIAADFHEGPRSDSIGLTIHNGRAL